MGLKSFFQRKDAAASAPASPRARQAPAAPAEPAEVVLQARTRARQRLIGAVVLLGIGIIGFPLLFETQPRPVAVDIPIDIPRKENAPPLQLPPPHPAADNASSAAAPVAAVPAPAPVVVASTASSAVITETAADAGRDVPPPVVPASAAAKVSADKPVADKPAPPKPTASANDAARALALLQGKPVDKAASASGRFIVQFGAFTDANTAHEARQKVERLGLKTYEQVATIDGSKRIRVRAGPFASHDEAAGAAGKIKSAGLNSVVLAL